MKILITQSRLSRQWHGSIIAGNNEIIYTQEPVHNLQDAIDTALSLRKAGLQCSIIVKQHNGTEEEIK